MPKPFEKRLLADAKKFIGLQIAAVRYMTEEESTTLAIRHRGLVLTLSDGTILYPMADDEGNDAGVLVASSPADGELRFSALDRR